MARPKRNHKIRWASKSANKGRKPSRGRIKGWSVKNYGIYWCAGRRRRSLGTLPDAAPCPKVRLPHGFFCIPWNGHRLSRGP